MTTIKRFLTLLFATLLTAFTMHVWGADESVTFSDVYSADDKPTTYNGTDFSVTFNKGTNSNVPVYKTTGAAVRIYGGGYFVVSSATKTITKIELSFGSGDGSNAITTDVSTYSAPNWTGSASSVKFTIGGTTGHRRLAGIAVTYSSGGGSATLSSIAVKTPPTKTTYTEGEYFDPTGLVLSTVYSDSSNPDIDYASHSSDFTFSPTTSTALTTSNTSVTITYGGKSTSQAITVNSGGGGGGGSCSVFHETWDGCEGSGGNDDTWSGSIATSTVNADNSGWTYSSSGGGDECLKVGASKTAGSASSPSISVTNGGEYSLEIQAAPWGDESCSLTVELTGAKFSDNTTSKTTSTMTINTWNTYSFDIIATAGSMSIDLSGSKNRFFLNEVCISETTSYTATFNNGGHGTAPGSTTAANVTLTEITGVSGYVNTGWTADKDVMVGGSNVTAGTAIPNGTTVVLKDDTQFTAQWVVARTVTWYVNGSPYTNGDPSTSVANGGKVTTLPTPPSDGTLSDCANKFMGWSKKNGGSTGRTTSYYDDLFTDVSGSPAINANTEFYAVFATVEGSVVDINFNFSAWGKSSMFSGSTLDEVSQTVDGITVTYTRNTGSLYANSTSMRFYKDNDLTFDAGSANITSIVFDGTTWQDDVTTNVGTCTSTSSALSWSGSSTSVTFSRSIYATSYAAYTSATIIVGGGSGSASDYRTSCGPKITAEDGKWVTSTSGKRVKIEIPIEATNFAGSTPLGASISGTGFSLPDGDSRWGTGGKTVTSNLTTSVIVIYQPTEYNTTNDATLTISGDGAEDAVVTVHGRSLPQKFVIAAQVNNTKKWKAVPANIEGAGEQNGISVETDNNADPTVVTEDYSTAFYGLTEVYAYDTYGTAVRFSATTGGKMLWGADSGNNINDVNGANSRNQEWILNTTDGKDYTITNAASTTNLKFFSGSKFGMFSGGKEKLRFIAAGCDNPPTAGSVSNIAEKTATISGWDPAVTVTIKLYSDAACTRDEVVYENVASSLNLTGLFSGYTYYYKVYSGVGCVSPVNSFTTLEGDDHMSVAEWQEDAVVISFNGDDADLVLSTYKEENTSEQELTNIAEDLFFAKYFEGEGNIKMISIYNGTDDDINLENYSILIYNYNSSNIHTSDANNVTIEFTSSDIIYQGQEIIFYSKDDQVAAVQDCSESFFESIATKNSPSDNPRWIERDNIKAAISGNDYIQLLKNSTPIDIFGATTRPEGKNCRSEWSWEGTITNMDYGKTAADFTTEVWANRSNYGINIDDPTIDIHTARCVLYRNASVISGSDAVGSNTDKFNTLTPGEWYGRNICSTGVVSGAGTCNSYSDLGSLDYQLFYEQYSTLVKDETFEDFRSDPFDGTYTIPVPGLINMACSNVRIDLADVSDPTTVLIRKEIQVPIMITEDDQLTTDEIFRSNEKTAEICQTCDLVILNGGVLTKAPDETENDITEVRDLKIYPGGKLVIPEDEGSNEYNFTVNSLAMRRQEDDICMADLQGTLNVHQANGVYLDLRIDPTNWHYVSLPYDCNVSNIKFSNGEDATLGTDYNIAWYDGAARARDKTGGWTDVTAGTTLKKGLGYIVSLPGDGRIKKELRFPMDNGVIADEKANKTVEYVYAYGGDKNDEELTPNHKGWNLIGNPYLMYYATDLTTPLAVGHLDEDGSTYKRSGVLRYLVAPINNGWSGYNQIAINTHMPPFTAYFVQIGANNKTGEDDPEDAKTVTFHQSAAGKTSIVRRRIPAEEVEDTHPVWFGVKMTAPNAEKDNTTLLISNDFTDDYDMMDDLVKMRGDYYQYFDLPVLASLNNAGEMAFNALPDVSAEAGVPLVYFASQAGTYTFAVDEQFMSDEVKSARLFDANTNEDHDLLADTYSFQTNRGENTNRFTLFVSVERKKAPQIATDIDNLYDDVAPRKVLINGHVYIVRGRAVYDLTGKQVLNR